MDHISLRLRSFKLHLTIPMNQRARLPQTLSLIYLPRINGPPLEINGEKIPPNRPAFLLLHRVRSAEVVDESEVVFSSMERVCANNELKFEVWIHGKKFLKGIFRRDIWWRLECEPIDQMISTKVTALMDEGFLMRKKVRLNRKRFCPKLPLIQEEDEEEMERSNSLNCEEKNEKDNGDGVVNKSFTWVMNVGILVACLGVGLFVLKASLKRLVGLNLL